MPTTHQRVPAFPSVSLPTGPGRAPVEVALLAQMGIGAGSELVRQIATRQSAHGAFVDALDEPSARIGAMHPEAGDTSSLYTFTVGKQGHPFHRHGGNRVFTAVSGSGGTRLRFSSATDEQIAANPIAFIDQFHEIILPPDSLFSVRFGGGVWHQFAPLDLQSGHPALFALSFHPDEFGGLDGTEARSAVAANAADIATLTQLLPANVQCQIDAGDLERAQHPVTHLSLEAPSTSWRARGCAAVRGRLGNWRSRFNSLNASQGFTAQGRNGLKVKAAGSASAASLLQTAFPDQRVHEDMFTVDLHSAALRDLSVEQILESVLEGFLENPPIIVGHLMALRNFLVKPLGLRTSPLGCPVSSLLGTATTRFAGRFPVHAQQISGDSAEVLLGADDKHLAFRSCVGVRRCGNSVRVSLGTRVRTANWFGWFYICAIDAVHRTYVSPAMLRMAAEHVLMRDVGAMVQSLD